MPKYKIYTEIKKIHLTNNLIVYSIFGICFFMFFINKAFNINLIDKITGITLGVIFIVGGIFKLLFSYSFYEPLKGKIENYLEIYDNEIVVENKVYLLSEIKSIDIWNFDFKDEISDYYSKGNFNGLKSNGVANLFQINLISEKIIDVHFQQDYGNQIINSKKELFNYYANGKISFTTLARVFGCKDNIDHETFEKTLPPTHAKSHG